MDSTIEQFNKQVPLLLQTFENSLRSGYSVAQSLEIIARDLPEPISSEASLVLKELEGGISLPEAFDKWLARMPSHDLDLIIAALRVQFEIGGNLADKFNLLTQLMNKRTLA